MNFSGVKRCIISKLEKELDIKLYYHGVHHTLDVMEAVERLGKLEAVTKYELLLLQTAALFHDSGFLYHYKNHEDDSMRIAQETLPEYGYDQTDIDKIINIILATRVPQNPKTHLERIMCDSDLDYLGRNDFEIIAETLFKELIEFGFIQNKKDWNYVQLNFLSHHSYFTKSAKKLRSSKKNQNLLKLKKIISHYSEES